MKENNEKLWMTNHKLKAKSKSCGASIIMLINTIILKTTKLFQIKSQKERKENTELVGQIECLQQTLNMSLIIIVVE